MSEYELESAFKCIHSRITEWVTEIMQDLADNEMIYDRPQDCVNDVPNRSYDGFIPYTDGGVEGIGRQDIGSVYGSGAVPNAIQPILESMLKDMDEKWDRENPEHTVAWLYPEKEDDRQLELIEGVRHSDLRDEVKERYYEFERTWLGEGTTYFYKVRALYYHAGDRQNKTGEDEVYFFVGINTDLEYGRDYIAWLPYMGGKAQQTEWGWERTVKAKDCTPSLLARIMKPALKALHNA